MLTATAIAAATTDVRTLSLHVCARYAECAWFFRRPRVVHAIDVLRSVDIAVAVHHFVRSIVPVPHMTIEHMWRPVDNIVAMLWHSCAATANIGFDIAPPCQCWSDTPATRHPCRHGTSTTMICRDKSSHDLIPPHTVTHGSVHFDWMGFDTRRLCSTNRMRWHMQPILWAGHVSRRLQG